MPLFDALQLHGSACATILFVTAAVLACCTKGGRDEPPPSKADSRSDDALPPENASLLCEVPALPPITVRYSETVEPFPCDLQLSEPLPTHVTAPVLAGEDVTSGLQIVVDGLHGSGARIFAGARGEGFERVIEHGQQLTGDEANLVRSWQLDHDQFSHLRISTPIASGKMDHANATAEIYATSNGAESWIDLQAGLDCMSLPPLIPPTTGWRFLQYLAEAPDEGTWLAISELREFAGVGGPNTAFVFYGHPERVQQRAITRYERTQNGLVNLAFEVGDETFVAHFEAGCPELTPMQTCEASLVTGRGPTTMISRYFERADHLEKLRGQCRYVVEHASPPTR